MWYQNKKSDWKSKFVKNFEEKGESILEISGKKGFDLETLGSLWDP